MNTLPAPHSLPPAPAAPVARPEPVVLSAELPPELEFEPIVRKHPYRGEKLTPEKQRKFINALAACGSVTTSAGAVGLSVGQVYHLRNSPGAESFAAAWDKAVERGARRVLDVLVDQAINGTPEYFYKDGQIVGERRHFNTRAMMWIVAHNFPEKYGVTGGLMRSASGPIGLKRMRDRWRAKWGREHMENEQRRADTSREETATMINAIRSGFKRNIAEEPAKRAAWELLTGPTDWSDIEKVPMYGNETPTNQQRPDMVVANAMGMDAMFGVGEAAEP